MKTVRFQPQDNIYYQVSTDFTTTVTDYGSATMSNDITVTDSTISNGFQLVSSDIKNLSHVWCGYNNKVLMYDSISKKLWVLYNGTVTLVNNDFASTISNLQTNISDDVTISDLKYSSYNDVLYLACQCNLGSYSSDDKADIRFIRLTGSDYSTINVSSGTFSTYSSRAHVNFSQYTYDGPYMAMVCYDINNYTTDHYNPQLKIAKSTDGSSWTQNEIITGDKSEFGAEATINSYNGTYYIYDSLGWYFNQTVGTRSYNSDPTNLSTYTANSILSGSWGSQPTLHVENGTHIYTTASVYPYFLNGSTLYAGQSYSVSIMLGAGDNKFFKTFTAFSSEADTDFINNTSTLDQYSLSSSCTLTASKYREQGAISFTLVRGDTKLTSSIFICDGYIYQLNSKGLVRCHRDDLVTVS